MRGRFGWACMSAPGELRGGSLHADHVEGGRIPVDSSQRMQFVTFDVERQVTHARQLVPRKHVADTPNHAGTKTHTSLSDMPFLSTHEPLSAFIAFQIHTEVICMPG